MALGASYYTELFATTIEKFEKQLVDNVLTSHPTLDFFRKEAKSYTGRTLVLPLEVAHDSSTTFTDAAGTFSTAVSSDIIGAAQYDWSSPLVSKARINWLTLQKNSGPEGIIDLMKAHIRAAEKGHARKIAQALHARAYNGTASELTSGQFNSLDQIVSNKTYDATPGSGVPFTVGGIDANAAGKDYWQATRYSSPVDGGEDIRKAFRSLSNTIVVNSMAAPKVIIAGLKIFEEYEDSFDDKIRYTTLGANGESRFKELVFDDMVVRLDPDCPQRRAYFLDPDTLRFGYLNGNFMKSQPQQQIQGTLDYVVPLASVIVVGTNERRANGVLLRPTTAGQPA